jgi:hypothetical protein
MLRQEAQIGMMSETNLFPNLPFGQNDPFPLLELSVECKLCPAKGIYPLSPEGVNPMAQKEIYERTVQENYQKAVYQFISDHTKKSHPEKAKKLEDDIERITKKDLLKNINPQIRDSFPEGKVPRMKFTCTDPKCNRTLEWDLPVKPYKDMSMEETVNEFVDSCHLRFMRKHIAGTHPLEYKELQKRARTAAGYMAIKNAKDFLVLREATKCE